MSGGVFGNGREESRVWDECFMFMIRHDSEARLETIISGHFAKDGGREPYKSE